MTEVTPAGCLWWHRGPDRRHAQLGRPITRKRGERLRLDGDLRPRAFRLVASSSAYRRRQHGCRYERSSSPYGGTSWRRSRSVSSSLMSRRSRSRRRLVRTLRRSSLRLKSLKSGFRPGFGPRQDLWTGKHLACQTGPERRAAEPQAALRFFLDGISPADHQRCNPEGSTGGMRGRWYGRTSEPRLATSRVA